MAGQMSGRGMTTIKLAAVQAHALRGQSRIVDSDGSVLGQLAEEEGVLTADVVMDLARKHYEVQPSFGGWLQPGSWAARHLIIPLDIAAGRLSYTISRERRR